MNFEAELQKIDDLIDLLSELSESDGDVSIEEQKLLDAIFRDLSDYRVLLLEVIEDNTITVEEEASIKRFKANIVNHVTEIAAHDGNISSDEKVLLAKIREFAT